MKIADITAFSANTWNYAKTYPPAMYVNISSGLGYAKACPSAIYANISSGLGYALESCTRRVVKGASTALLEVATGFFPQTHNQNLPIQAELAPITAAELEQLTWTEFQARVNLIEGAAKLETGQGSTSSLAKVSQVFIGFFKKTTLSTVRPFILKMLNSIGEKLDKEKPGQSGVKEIKKLIIDFKEAFDKGSTTDLTRLMAQLIELANAENITFNGFSVPLIFTKSPKPRDDLDAMIRQTGKTIEASIARVEVSTKISETEITELSIHSKPVALFVKNLGIQLSITLLFDVLAGFSLSKKQETEIFKLRDSHETLVLKAKEIIATSSLSWARKFILPKIAYLLFILCEAAILSSLTQLLPKIQEILAKEEHDLSPIFTDISGYLTILSMVLSQIGIEKKPTASLPALIEQYMEENQIQKSGYSSTKLYRTVADLFLRNFGPKLKLADMFCAYIDTHTLKASSIILKTLENGVKIISKFVARVFLFIPQWLLNQTITISLRASVYYYRTLELSINNSLSTSKKYKNLVYALNTFLQEEFQIICQEIQTSSDQNTFTEELKRLADHGTRNSVNEMLRNFFETLMLSRCKTLYQLYRKLNTSTSFSNLEEEIFKSFFEKSIDELALVVVAAFKGFTKKEQKEGVFTAFLNNINDSFLNENEPSDNQLLAKEEAINELIFKLMHLAIQYPLERKLDFSGDNYKRASDQFLEALKKAFTSFHEEIQMLGNVDSLSERIGDELGDKIRVIHKTIISSFLQVRTGGLFTPATQALIMNEFETPIVKLNASLCDELDEFTAIKNQLNNSRNSNNLPLYAFLDKLATSVSESDIKKHLIPFKIIQKSLCTNHPAAAFLAVLIRDFEDFLTVAEVGTKFVKQKDMKNPARILDIDVLTQQLQRLKTTPAPNSILKIIGTLKNLKESLQRPESNEIKTLQDQVQKQIEKEKNARKKAMGEQSIVTKRHLSSKPFIDLPTLEKLHSQKLKSILDNFAELNKMVQSFQPVKHMNLMLFPGAEKIATSMGLFAVPSLNDITREVVEFLRLPHNWKGMINIICSKYVQSP